MADLSQLLTWASSRHVARKGHKGFLYRVGGPSMLVNEFNVAVPYAFRAFSFLI